MPRYNTSASKANTSELDPCLAAELRLSRNRCCGVKAVCFAIVVLLLFIVGAILLFALDWNETTEVKFPSQKSPNLNEPISVPPQKPPQTVPRSQSAPNIQIQPVPSIQTVPKLNEPVSTQPPQKVVPISISVPPQKVVPISISVPPQKPISISISVPPQKPIHSSIQPEKLEHVNKFGSVFATCDEYFKHGFTQNGVYKLQGPTGYDFLAQCVMNEGDGKAWMVMQKRTSGELPFWNRTYDEYVQGFGSPNGDHWLGLKQVRDLIDAGYNLQLKVEIKGDRCEKELDDLYYFGVWKFEIDSSATNYRLRVSDILSGNFTQPLYSIVNSNALSFSKADSTVLTNCLEKLHLGGWWSTHNGCSFISLNGEYTCEKKGTLFGLSVYSSSAIQRGNFKFNNIRPKSTRMMLRVCNGEKDCTS